MPARARRTSACSPDTPLTDVVAHLAGCGVEVEHGPDHADGARHPLRSVWFRDPDGNLVEVANRAEG